MCHNETDANNALARVPALRSPEDRTSVETMQRIAVAASRLAAERALRRERTSRATFGERCN